MRVLLAHNHYGSAAPSGENAVFELEKEMRERRGHEVLTIERHSDDIRKKGMRGTVVGAISTPWNPFAARRVRSLIASFQPDVMHAHNTFPLLSPSIFSAARGVARVLTLHNYRLVCPAAIPMRKGEVCTECLDQRSAWPSVVHGCYRESRLATLPLATNVALHRTLGTWTKEVEAFIALSSFQKEMMAHAGLTDEKIEVKANFYPGDPQVTPLAERPEKVVFVGRMSEEKGAGDLVEAWLSWGEGAPVLKMIGDGPLKEVLSNRAGRAKNISFTGQISGEEAQSEIASARLAVMPSRWFEGFPMVLREAFALGTPAAVSDLGPLPDIVKPADGVVFPVGDPKTLEGCLKALWADSGRLENMSRLSRQVFEERYTEDANYEELLSIYERAIERAERPTLGNTP